MPGALLQARPHRPVRRGEADAPRCHPLPRWPGSGGPAAAASFPDPGGPLDHRSRPGRATHGPARRLIWPMRSAAGRVAMACSATWSGIARSPCEARLLSPRRSVGFAGPSVPPQLEGLPGREPLPGRGSGRGRTKTESSSRERFLNSVVDIGAGQSPPRRFLRRHRAAGRFS